MSRWDSPAAWYDVLNPWGPSDDSYLGLRFLGAEPLTTFLHEAGLVVDEQFGDWSRGPLTETSAEEIITVARRVSV